MKLHSDAISMRLRVFNIADAFMFPIVYSDFTQRPCILIELFHRFVYNDQQILIHMIIPNANVIKFETEILTWYIAKVNTKREYLENKYESRAILRFVINGTISRLYFYPLYF